MRRTAVIDLGSGSFRLVVYDWEPGGRWTVSDELREAVRISARMGPERVIAPDAIDRAVSATERFTDFCRAAGIHDVIAVGTSAIRDARNRDDVLRALRDHAGLEVRVLSGREEARYGYLAAVSSTDLTDGLVIEMGGGSIQLSRVSGRELVEAESFPFGAVRVTERFRPGDGRSTRGTEALRSHVAAEIDRLGWWRGCDHLVAIGGSVRNLAKAARKRGGESGSGIQGFLLTRDALAQLIGELAALPASGRGEVPGIKRDRGDVILGAALVLETAMAAGGCDEAEVTKAGLREGVFLERFLAERP